MPGLGPGLVPMPPPFTFLSSDVLSNFGLFFNRSPSSFESAIPMKTIYQENDKPELELHDDVRPNWNHNIPFCDARCCPSYNQNYCLAMGSMRPSSICRPAVSAMSKLVRIKKR